MLGNYVKTYLSKYYNIIPLTRKEYDINQLSINSLIKLLKSYNIKKNDIVINCSGVIPQSVSQTDNNIKRYYKINSLFPVMLSNICNQVNVKMIHITTDCVFSGKDGNYDENSIHDETNIYGSSKSLGELCNTTIIRTSIIGEELNNKRSLLEWVKSNSGKTINGYINHLWNGVTCLQLCNIIYKIIKNNNYWIGVRHIYSPRLVSKYELNMIINKIYDLKININRFETVKKVDKTITSIYNTNSSFNIPDIKEQIIKLKEYKLNK